ncbi:uncharacterized protein G2W53_005294 [Senna tora]|uniref:Secreted protein n=1 Tax=Senna tora TaxID=362788 RepID=A0A835CH73_9FABA|nr:uncharacterized protein G2W53_005294 [Senna tora]
MSETKLVFGECFLALATTAVGESYPSTWVGNGKRWMNLRRWMNNDGGNITKHPRETWRGPRRCF